jgi:hypothetical protein
VEQNTALSGDDIVLAVSKIMKRYVTKRITLEEEEKNKIKRDKLKEDHLDAEKEDGGRDGEEIITMRMDE